MWRSHTFRRLFLSCAGLSLGVIALLGMLLFARVELHYMDQMEDRLRAQAVLGVEMVRGRPLEDMSALQQRFEALRRREPLRITLLAADGTVLVESDRDPRQFAIENHGDRPEVLQALRRGIGISRSRRSATVGQDLMYVAIRTDDDNGAVAFVRAAWPLADIKAKLSELRGIVWSAAAVAGLIALALSFWLARSLTRPFQELTAGAEKIAAGNYGHKVYDTARDEVGVLARSFNHMSVRLAAQFAQLEEDRQQLRMILGGMVEGVVALDADENILFANERAAQLLGFGSQAMTGRKLWEIVRRRSLQDIVRRALSEPEPCKEELDWNGPMTESLTVHAARLPGWPTRGAVLVLHDTSELRRLERLRRDFVANVSHELKTPLAVIKACVETLLEGAVEDAEHRGSFLTRIAEQSERLHALILDLLSLARIESGREAFAFEAVRLEPVVNACLERHRARAEGKKLLLQAIGPTSEPETEWQGDGETRRQGDREIGRQEDKEQRISASIPLSLSLGLPTSLSPNLLVSPSPPLPLSPSSPIAAWADEEAVDQILDNLVDNAVKYTPPGGRIRVRWGAENGQVFLEVAD
ncbi:MAG TPA: histidine kinase dimerization/phospho-acceptor domain-containing protein, partial [Gemmataceae bacterium]|nr:histidine kinase dimerization/phospho-acceptor domain-containing protein [Gemmataceae bacterium]